MHYFRLTPVNIIEPNTITKKYLDQIAFWHNQTPKLWVPNYKASTDDIEETIQRIQKTNPDDLFLGVSVDASKNLQGFIWAYKHTQAKNSVMIMSLYISKSHRKGGHATQLKCLLENWCREEGIKTIETTVHYENHKMLKLNKKMGYKPGMVHMIKPLD